ncbi:hypothetical protein Aperf_G00000104661 [Anoplocephala perfoliata]
MLIVASVGMIPGFILMILLIRLDGKTRTSLLLLRTMLICTFLQLLVIILNEIFPYPINTDNTGFNLFMCGFWSSQILHMVLAVTGIHVFVYFSLNRTMQIVENLQFSFASSRNADLVYIAGLFLYSAIIAMPQIFTIDFSKNGCHCDKELANQTFLDFAYARVYIFFVQVLIVNATILAICSGLIIRWVKNTPKDKFYDTLNVLSFPNTSGAELKAYEAGKRWSTSSMCIVPLSCTFVLSHSCYITYQFLSAIGTTKFYYSGQGYKILGRETMAPIKRTAARFSSALDVTTSSVHRYQYFLVQLS